MALLISTKGKKVALAHCRVSQSSERIRVIFKPVGSAVFIVDMSVAEAGEIGHAMEQAALDVPRVPRWRSLRTVFFKRA